MNPLTLRHLYPNLPRYLRLSKFKDVLGKVSDDMVLANDRSDGLSIRHSGIGMIAAPRRSRNPKNVPLEAKRARLRSTGTGNHGTNAGSIKTSTTNGCLKLVKLSCLFSRFIPILHLTPTTQSKMWTGRIAAFWTLRQ